MTEILVHIVHERATPHRVLNERLVSGHEDGNEEVLLAALRRARAQAAVSRLRQAAAGHDTMSDVEIAAEISQARRALGRQPGRVPPPLAADKALNLVNE